MRLRVRFRSPLLPLLPLCLACEPTADPAAVATSFWQAAQHGDVARAEQLVSATSAAAVSDPGPEGSGITEVTLGAVDIAGNRATVATHMVNDWAGEPRTIAFSTQLVRELGRWRVDLDRTADEMVQGMTPPKWLGVPRGSVPTLGGDTVMARDTAR